VSFGGWSLVPEADAAEAILASELVTRSGVAGYGQAALDRYLADRVVTVFPYIDETQEGFFGRASTDELETLFQLIHLYMTEPRADEVGLRRMLDEVRPFAEDPTSEPQLAVAIELADARFDDPRFLPIPSVEDLDTFDMERSLEIFRERFADASDFVFVVAGDFEEQATIALIREYLGTLPALDRDEGFADIRTPRQPGVLRRTVRAGSGELGAIAMFWDLPVEVDAVTRVEADLLELVIRRRLTDHIREELSATYSPLVNLEEIDEPYPALELTVLITADPEDLDSVAAAVIADLAELRTEGPTTAQLESSREQLLRNLELFSNEMLVDVLTFYMLRPDEDPEDVFLEPDRAAAATAADVRDLARRLIDPDDYIDIRLVPEATG
jgi:zinc protease